MIESNRCVRVRKGIRTSALFASLLLVAIPTWAQTIAFVQRNSSAPQTPQTTVAVAYTAAQTSGNLNVVVVGWNDTTSNVQSVGDSLGNTYQLAVGPTSGTGLRQSIYYASRIKAGTNTVTVTFSAAAAYPDIRILEYSGVNTLDVVAAAVGSSTAANSGAATTTTANELVFGANMVATLTSAAGSGFTSRVITSPDGDIAEDRIVTATGSYSASATLANAGPWIMQMATFKNVTGPAPTVTGVAPPSGSIAGGTSVTITGTNFVTGATVTVGGVAATGVTVASATSITATTPAHAAGAVGVTVTNPDTQTATLSNAFTYVGPAPTVTSVAPTSGPIAGGTSVTITGTNFVTGATVTIGGTAATGVAVASSTSITATTAAHVAGLVGVTVTNPDTQTATLANAFTYVAPAPTVTAIAPTSGPIAGGTNVTITGTNFVTGATVTIGGTAATGVTVASATSITATTPAHAAGLVAVTVTNPDTQSATRSNAFTYLGPAPTVTGIAPTSGLTGGGTSVTITGTNFVTGASVTIGGTAATGVTVASATSITATTAAHTAGLVGVTVTNPDTQAGTLANAFTYVAPAPTVTGIAPTSGPIAGGTSVTITGTNFVTGATVTIGGTAATGVTVASATSITATTAAHAAGLVDVTVTNPDTQTGTLASAFTYVAPAPTVTGIAPTSGPIAGGTSVTITGTNFVSGATVTIGGTAATGVTVASATSITATTGAHVAGLVGVTVTNPDTQTATLNNAFTYLGPAPTVTGIAPTSGPIAGGTSVTITGTNFVTGAIVTIGGTAATGVTVASATSITATTAAHAAGLVGVTVTNPDTQTATLANAFTYVAPAPTVTGIAPTSGPIAGGTSVTITGTNFVTGATVTIGGTAATGVTVASATSITATTAAHAVGLVAVTVTNPDTQSATLNNAFTYLGPAPTVTGIAPTSGPIAGGTSVTITGTNFVTGATVTIGGTSATGVTVASATSITATTAAHAASLVGVTVTNPDTQTATLNNAFTYLGPAPTVTAIAPTSGTTGGGTSVTITGTNFVTGATVTIGGTAATGVTVASATSITATTAAHAAGLVGVTVTNPDTQAATLANAFTYVAPAPTVTTIAPTSGPIAGGTSVTITGTNFVTGATVTIGGTAATGVTVASATSITATTAAHAAGLVSVTVTNPDTQTATLGNAFTYVAPAPTITGIAPTSGPIAGGTSVTITGTNFVTGATVTIGGTAATGVTVASATSITATTAAHAAGLVGVTVTNPDSQSATLNNAFTFVGPAPTVTGIAPASGPIAGGTSVTITGTNFVTGATVTIGGTAATGVTVASATSITATTAAHTAGLVGVTVTNPDTQAATLANAFTYLAPAPTVTGIAPPTGPIAGGTSVTITGTNFVTGATVTIGGTAATGVTVTNATTIAATTAAHAAGLVGVTVTNPDTQSGTLSNIYTYVAPAPTVTGIAPVSGPIAGGTSVTITGTNFVTGATVKIGGTAATGVTVTNATSITATTAAHAAGLVGVTVTNPDSQTATLNNAFTYLGPAPTVTSIAPTSGPTGGGTSVTITGTNFVTGATVTIGGTAATGVTVASATSITATTAAHASGLVGVTVTNPDTQAATLANAFTYSGASPTAPTNLAGTIGAVGPSIATVQGYINSTALTSHTTAAFDSTGGDLIVLAASSHAGVTFTPTDSLNNTWISIAGPTNTVTGVDLREQIWYARSPNVGPNHTITMGLSALQSLVMSVFVVKGTNVSSPIDAVSLIGSDNGSQAVAAASPAITTSVANDFLMGWVKVSSGSTFTSGTGFVQQPNASSNFFDAESGQAGAPGSYTATFTISQPVTWQTAVVAAATNQNQVTLTWSASTETGGSISAYLIERCQGIGCNTFTQIATSTTTSFTDTGLSPSTSYSYRVRARDASNVTGPYSAVVNVSTPATIPAAPGNVVATSASASQINLSWIASREIGGTVSNYHVERCAGSNCTNFVEVGTTASTAYSDTGLVGSTSYTYRVRAADSVGGLSPYSNMASATTGTAAPTIFFVQVASATPQSSTATVTLAYPTAQAAGNLNVVVVGWNDTTATITSVRDSAGNSYSLAVGPTSGTGLRQSIYYAPNILAGGNTVTVTFSQAASFPDVRILEYKGVGVVDATAGASGNSGTASAGSMTTTTANELIFGAGMVATVATGAGSGFITRTITSPDGDIAEDQIVNGVGSYTATASLAPGAWVMQAVAFKAAGGGGPDTQPPTPPGALGATPISGSEVDLSWTASTDNVGVTGYLIERCQGTGCSTFTQIAAPTGTGTTFADLTVAASTSYTYRVRATDAASNLSSYSNTASATTPTPDTTPPTTPGTLVATAASGTEIDVSWGPSTDDVGVAGYRLERCQGVGCSAFTKFGTLITGTSYADTSLTPSTSYSYIVRAQDAAGNLSPYSNVGTATTLATSAQLVAAYAFNEGTGTTVTDLSGHGNNGTLTSATWTASGKYGNALVFNGSNAIVTIPDSASLHLTTAMTLEAWVNPTAISTAWRDIIYKANDNYYLEASSSNGSLPVIGETIGTSHAESYGVSTLALNTWTHVAATYDGTTLRLFINGAQVSSLPVSGPLVTSTNPLQIGGDSLYGQFFQGTIDEVRVYAAALTPSQIQADMTTPIGGTLPAVSLTSTNVDFGSQAVGSTSAPTTVTLTNIGSGSLTIGSISLTGAQPTAFGQTNNCVTTLAANASCGINITFTPNAVGAEGATVTISDNAPGTPHTIGLTGTGTGFTVTPHMVSLTANQTQQFTASGASGTVIWTVDGVAGGSATVGTITTSGVYTAPAAAGSHTVTGTISGQSTSANATAFTSTIAGMFTHHNDNQRTGQNLAESVLTPTLVNASSFGKLTSYATDGISHASPLYVANVNIPGLGLRNVVYVSTEHDSVYAFDADGRSTGPLWHVSFINPSAGITTVPNGDTGECCDIQPEIGITGTPVIDPASGTLYVVAKTKEGPSTYVQRLHALDITTGAEKFGGPVVIHATVPGTGVGSSAGQLSLDPLRENQRTALLLNGGNVYFGFGSHGDNEPYHGWLLGYNATTLAQVLVFASTPNGEGGGIWQSGGGLAIDASGNFIFATGDGTYDVDTGGIDYGDSFLKLSPTGTVLDYFTPHDQSTLNSNNLDLDAGGMVLPPDQTGAHPHLLVSSGKSGSIYVVDRDNMSHYHTTDGNVQTLVNIFPFGTPLPGNYSSPVYFGGNMYFGPVADRVQAFTFTNGLLSTTATSSTPESFGYPGGALAISANGSANAILWAVQKNGTAAGVLRAYNASNIAVEYYSSDQSGSRDALASAAKFAIPLVINGKVFVATESTLTVYGLLP